jgi:cell division protein FtsQ
MAELDRLERDARARRARGHAHLSRLRQRGRVVHEGAGFRLPRRVRLAALACAALLGSCAGQAFIALGGGGAVDAIAVRGASRLSPREIARATGIPRGARLSEVETEAVVAALEAHDWIASARALRWPGGRVVVEVVEREPLAALAVGERRFAIDASGAAFTELRPGQEDALPRLVAEQAPQPGAADPLRAEAAGLAARLPELGLAAPDEVRVAAPGDPEGVSLRLPGLAGVVVLGTESLESRLRDLARLLEQRRDEASRAARIDLRFADQAVLRSAAAQEGSREEPRRGGDAARSTRSSG